MEITLRAWIARSDMDPISEAGDRVTTTMAKAAEADGPGRFQIDRACECVDYDQTIVTRQDRVIVDAETTWDALIGALRVLGDPPGFRMSTSVVTRIG